MTAENSLLVEPKKEKNLEEASKQAYSVLIDNL